MGYVATLLPNQLRHHRLRAALRDRYCVVACTAWSELMDVCAREPVNIAVVDLFATDSINTGFDWIRQLKRLYPSVSVVSYVSLPPARPRDLFEAGRFGLDGLIVADQDDEPRRMLSLIEQAEARGVLHTLRSAIAGVKPTARDATLIVVTRAHERLSPETLAKILGIRRKTLSERLSRAGFPTAQRLIAWGRLILAARMLEDSERSADSVALALDFPSGSAFRNTCQRYLAAAPQQIRARGGATYVIAAFLEQINRQNGAPEALAPEARAPEAASTAPTEVTEIAPPTGPVLAAS